MVAGAARTQVTVGHWAQALCLWRRPVAGRLHGLVFLKSKMYQEEAKGLTGGVARAGDQAPELRLDLHLVRALLLVVAVLALRVGQGDLLEQVLLVEGADDLAKKQEIRSEEMKNLHRRNMHAPAAPWGCGRLGIG